MEYTYDRKQLTEVLSRRYSPDNSSHTTQYLEGVLYEIKKRDFDWLLQLGVEIERKQQQRPKKGFFEILLSDSEWIRKEELREDIESVVNTIHTPFGCDN